MIVQAILLGLVAMLGNAEYLLGTSCLSRPLVMGALTGIVMGDIPTGVTLGAHWNLPSWARSPSVRAFRPR